MCDIFDIKSFEKGQNLHVGGWKNIELNNLLLIFLKNSISGEILGNNPGLIDPNPHCSW